MDFLFVANRPILDLLNTKPVLAEGPTELLPDFHALERWLIASGIVHSAKTKTPFAAGGTREAAAFLEKTHRVPRKAAGGCSADGERLDPVG